MAAAVAGGEVDVEPKHLDYELLKSLQSGNRRTVERFFPQEVSMAIDPSDATNIADQAGRWRGVTVGGNSALHIAADFGHFELAELICTRDSSLLTVRNGVGETPLHCAARAGADRIVSLFISEARRLEVLRAKDREGKTALHAAAQEGRTAVARVLMSADPELAAIDDDNGVSPLYAAALSRSYGIVNILTGSRADEGDTPDASYAGPNGQTALHAAAMIENREIAKKLLQWKSILTKKVDGSKRTPLHYLATTSCHYMVRQLLDHDTSPAYISDSKGLYPVHVAAMMGRSTIIRELTNSCPDMSELVDGRGRNFLHIAIQHEEMNIVWFVCRRPLLSKMMNARDCEGNTPLHLAVKSKNKIIVSLLLANISVHPSIVNKNGESPLDFAIAELYFDTYSTQLSTRNWIYQCLKRVGASKGPRGLGHLFDKNLTQPDLENESKKYENALQNLLVASVLIATVTFAAVFSMPGGYIADDHPNGGSPTLGRKYAFKAFIVADSIAFSWSVLATIGVMYAVTQVVDRSRLIEFIIWIQDFISMAALFMVAAFALSFYVQLAPLSKPITFFVCVVSVSSMFGFACWLGLEKFLLAVVLTRRIGWDGMGWYEWAKHCFFIFGQLAMLLGVLFIYMFLLPVWPTN